MVKKLTKAMDDSERKINIEMEMRKSLENEIARNKVSIQVTNKDLDEARKLLKERASELHVNELKLEENRHAIELKNKTVDRIKAEIEKQKNIIKISQENEEKYNLDARKLRHDLGLLQHTVNASKVENTQLRARISNMTIDAKSISQEYEMTKSELEKNIHNEELKKRLTPDHTPLCKRLIWSSDYYPAIQKPECTLITDPIKKIINEGIELSDNNVIDLDVIVFATGFRVDQFLRPIKTFGIDGIYLDDYWKEYPKAYLSIAIPKFPNLFLLNGPNGPVGNFSLIDIAEQQMNYILELIKIIRNT